MEGYPRPLEASARPLRLLVTGASGFIGSRLCQVAEERGLKVKRALHRPTGSGVVVGDLGPATDWRPALRDIDAIVHLAARVHVMNEPSTDPLEAYRSVNCEGTLRLAQQAVEVGVRRLVFVSTIKVNGEHTASRPFTAEDTPRPKDPYAISKAEAEDKLWRLASATGLEVVVVRPPLVYGPGVGGNMQRLMQLIALGVPLPLGAVKNKRSLIGRDNIVDFLIRCAAHPAATGEVYTVSDGDDLSTPDLIRRMAAALHCRQHLLPVPPAILSLCARLAGQSKPIERLCGSLQVDTTKARRQLAWHPPVRVDDELKRTCQRYLQAQRITHIGPSRHHAPTSTR